MLIDKCEIYLKAGNGGNGIISWRKEAHYPEGGPWGGDGGRGGSIYIVGDHNLNSLMDLRYRKKIEAKNGENGQTKLCHGKSADDVYIKVPVGTTIFDLETNEEIVDILKSGQTYLICKGGNGGRGNFYFKSSRNRIPNMCENGDLGEGKKVRLELKYIADVGLLGLPNAGKSTLVNSLSNTNLKTANYPFTTLTPSLGVVKHKSNRLIFADIPGIIENASSGIGLGLEFLKHIERCHFLIHLVSVLESDTNDPFQDYETIVKELQQYNKNILEKKIYLVLNKIDTEKTKNNIDKFLKKIKKKNPNQKVYLISGLNKDGVETLLDDIFSCYEQFKDVWNQEFNDKINSYSLVKVEKEQEDVVEYFKDENDVWNVKSKRILYWLNKIPFNTEDNIVRFMQKVKMDEIELKLKELGAKSGDTFKIGDEEFTVG